MERKEPTITIEAKAREIMPVGPVRRAVQGMSTATVSMFNYLRSNSVFALTSPNSDVPKGKVTSQQQMAAEAALLLKMVRYAYDHDGLLRHALNFGSQSVAGSDGPVIRWKHSELKAPFAKWSKNADPCGDLPLGQIVHGTHLDDQLAGDCFVRRVDVPFDGKTVPFKLQVLPAEMVPHDLNRRNADGTEVIGGIVFRGDMKLGYMVYSRHPHAIGDAGPLTTEFVSVDEMCQVYRPVPGKRSVRGVTRTVAALPMSYRLQGYLENEIKRKQLTTLFAGFIKDIQGSVSRESSLPNVVNTADGGLGIEWDGGMLLEIPAGKDITFSNVADNSAGAQPFIKFLALIIAAAMDLPYEHVVGDFSDGDRVAQVSSTFFDQFVRQERDRLEHQLVDRIADWFVEYAVAFGLWQPPDGVPEETWADHTTSWPSRTYKHPVQDVDAKRKAIDGGLLARDSVNEEGGVDTRENDISQARSLVRAKLLGMKFDTKIEFVDTELTKRLEALEFIELDALITAMERSDRDGSVLDPK